MMATYNMKEMDRMHERKESIMRNCDSMTNSDLQHSPEEARMMKTDRAVDQRYKMAEARGYDKAGE